MKTVPCSLVNLATCTVKPPFSLFLKCVNFRVVGCGGQQSLVSGGAGCVWLWLCGWGGEAVAVARAGTPTLAPAPLHRATLKPPPPTTALLSSATQLSRFFFILSLCLGALRERRLR